MFSTLDTFDRIAYGRTDPTTGPVWAHWHGGDSYAAPDWAEPAPRFDTVADAVAEFESAYHGHGFRLADDTDSGATPCVDWSASMALFYADPAESGDPYPDLLFEVKRHPDTDEYVTDHGAPVWVLSPC